MTLFFTSLFKWTAVVSTSGSSGIPSYVSKKRSAAKPIREFGREICDLLDDELDGSGPPTRVGPNIDDPGIATAPYPIHNTLVVLTIDG